MNYFNETEKSLKRYLKSKVSITMATVVGFMIAGSVSFGADMSQEEFNKMQETSYGKQFTSGETTLVGVKANGNEISHEKYIVTVSSGAKLTIDKDSVISTNGTNKYALNITENSTVVNNGEIIFNPTGFSGKVAVQLNGGAATKEKPATLINNNKIIGQNWLGNTIEMSGNSTLINSGIITGNIVGSNYKGQAGTQVINLKKGSHIEGTIKLNGTGENLINIDGVKNENSETIDIQSKNVEVTINNSDVILTGNISNEEGTAISVNNKDGNNTIVNNATIVAETGIGVMNEGSDNSTAASDRLVSITNNGDITAKYYGIYNNGYFTKHNKIEITNTGNILVNDFVIDKETYDKPYYYATGIYQASGPYTKTAGIVRNDGGEVRVELTAEQYAELKAEYEKTQGNMYLNIHGIRIHEHSEGYNTGDIIVNAFGGNGVVLSAGDTGANAVEEFKDRYNYFENAGNIVVTGENGIGLALKNTTEAKMEAINDSTGVITVNGDNAIAVKVNGNAMFTNKGMLVLGEEGVNKKAIVLENGGKATNNGIVQVLGTELAGVTSKEEALDKLFTGELSENNGLIVDKDGNALFAGSEETTVTEDTTTDILESLSDIDGSLTLKGDITLSEGASNPEVTSDVLNVIEGTTTVASKNEVNIEAENINMDKDGKFAIEQDATLGLSNGTVNKSGDREVIENDGTLNLTNMDINGDITGTGTINATGNNIFNGNIQGKDINNKITINFGDMSSTLRLMAVSGGKTNIHDIGAENNWSNTTPNIGVGHQLAINVTSTGKNVFGNSTGMVVTGTNDADIMFKTGNLSGNKITLDLGDNSFINVEAVTDSEIYKAGEIVDNTTGTKDSIVLEYNDKLYGDNAILDNINAQASSVSNYFSMDKATRKAQQDTLYANNIYSETARAAYDMMKLNEESVLSLNADTKVGEWVAAGKALYNKTEYDRTGTVGEYTSETETSGLMAGLEYGVNETTSVGVAFSGAIQDIDTDGGSVDGNVFYLGTYAKKQVGKLSLIAGLGYQYGDYDADNTAASVTSSASYDVNAYSAYVEGRYGVDLGDNVTFEPKLKLGYTYVDQENVSDDYFRLSDSELSTFDAEIGADLVKSVALKSGKLDVRFGASYVRAFGDTDDKFTGSFAGSTGSFDVLGAELSEDTAKFDLGVEVSKDNGVFYNLGGTLRVGSDSTRNYGVKLGAGYKF